VLFEGVCIGKKQHNGVFYLFKLYIINDADDDKKVSGFFKYQILNNNSD